MFIIVNGTKLFYKRHIGSPAVILLHGWGGTHALMDSLFDSLAKAGADVISIDLPGFGQSPVPPAHFGIDDYAHTIRLFIKELGLNNVTIVGHSFGGRIAILLGADSEIKSLVLVSSAGIKPRFSLKKKIAVLKYKRAKKKGKDLSAFGSKDYQALSGEMRAIFVRVINRHLNKDVKKIKVPTLLIWGKNDTETPLYMAKKIKKRIKDCGLVLLSGGHFAYLENANQFSQIINSFVLRS